MNINKIAAGVQNTVSASKSGRNNKITTSFLIRASEDAFESLKPKTKLQKQLLKMADEVWQDMKMPQSVKPRITFVSMLPDDAGGTSFSNCKMYLPNEDIKLLTDITLTKGLKATVAHELKHAEQLYSISRLIGAEEFEKTALEKQNIILDTGWFEYVVKELGRISPYSNEGKYAQKCLNAYIHYPELNPFDTPIPKAVKQIRYNHNFLERDARKFEKQYQDFTLRKIIASKIFNLNK